MQRPNVNRSRHSRTFANFISWHQSSDSYFRVIISVTRGLVIQLIRVFMSMELLFMGLLQLRYEHDSSTIRLRFERDTTSYEELCAFEQ